MLIIKSFGKWIINILFIKLVFYLLILSSEIFIVNGLALSIKFCVILYSTSGIVLIYFKISLSPSILSQYFSSDSGLNSFDIEYLISLGFFLT